MSMKKPMFLESTEVEADRSAAEIATELVKAGARRIATHHDDGGKITGIDWTLRAEGRDISFSMPARIEGVYQHLKRRAGSNVPERSKLQAKAERIAWRQLLTWVKVQNAMIEAGMCKPHEVFMPYALAADGRTAFEVWNAQLALPAPEPKA